MSSNSTRVNKIYKSRHVLLEQLEDRGYNTDDYNHFSINEIDAMFVNNQLDMLVKHTENDKQVYIKYYFTLKSNTKQMKPQVLDNIVEDLYLIDNVLTKRDTLVIVRRLGGNIRAKNWQFWRAGFSAKRSKNYSVNI